MKINTIFIYTLSIVALSALTAGNILATDAPLEIGGFSLGENIESYNMTMQSNYLKEIVVTDRHGFRKGVISYGICKYPGQIVKIKLKYEDSSKKYFKTLLKKYKELYGPPHEWNGDSFGILHIWKWYFTDKNNRKVSLTLQHNLKDPNDNIGNMVKLTHPQMMREERMCFNQMCAAAKSSEDKKKLEEMKKPDWKYLLPR